MNAGHSANLAGKEGGLNPCKALLLFFLAGVLEIGGGYLVWQWLREDWSILIGVLGGFLLFLYGIVPTLQPAYFHRVYAAYGGFFIVMSMAWGWVFDGVLPDLYDVIGMLVAVAGVAIIYFTPRGSTQ